MICVPIIAKTNEEAIEKMARLAETADIIELRVDYLPNPDLPRLLENKPKPVIVTCRIPKDGGKYGSLPEHGGGNEAKRVEMLVNALKLGADYVDVEFDAPEESRKKILEAATSPGQVVISYHNFETTPTDLQSIKDRMAARAPGAMVKIAVFANSINDNLHVFSLLKSKKEGECITAFCMGEKGEASRILSPIFGGEWTFGSLEPGEESAPGQIPASVLKDIYRVNQLTKNVEIYGLIGNPVKESMGYLIHNKSYIKMGMNRIYLPFLVEDLESFIENFRGLCKGFSVTMPFKQNIIPLLDRIDPTAEKIGAVNTLHITNGKLAGSNTDSSGAIQALEEQIPLAGKTILMIGAGGVARAIGFGAVNKGAKIVIFDVDVPKAKELAKDLGGTTCSSDDFNHLDFDILINCSPIGMHPKVDQTPFSKGHLKSGTVVFDAIYNPLETRLLKEARDAGCKAIRGVELFVNQAVGQFELWTGKKAPKEVMAEVVMEKLRQ